MVDPPSQPPSPPSNQTLLSFQNRSPSSLNGSTLVTIEEAENEKGSHVTGEAKEGTSMHVEVLNLRQ